MSLQKVFRFGIALRRRFRQSEATFILLAVVVGAVGGGLAVLLGAAAHQLQRWLYHLPGTMRLNPKLIAISYKLGLRFCSRRFLRPR